MFSRSRRSLARWVGIRVSTFYYCFILCMCGLLFGIGSLLLTGGGFLAADPSVEEALHGSEWVVAHSDDGEHHQTVIGNFLFGRQADAHAGWYCGHDERFVTIDGVLHKQVFLSHEGGDVHRYKAAHFAFTGTGYTRLSDWFYNKVQC